MLGEGRWRQTRALVEWVDEQDCRQNPPGPGTGAGYAQRTADLSRYRVRVPERVDVKAIRTGLGMSQQEFAGRFGFSVNTLRHWEQGTRTPEGAARAYLRVIDRAPKAVQKALQRQRLPPRGLLLRQFPPSMTRRHDSTIEL
jgi:putative transcriptional regulator